MRTANPSEALSRTLPVKLQTEPRGEKLIFHFLGCSFLILPQACIGHKKFPNSACICRGSGGFGKGTGGVDPLPASPGSLSKHRKTQGFWTLLPRNIGKHKVLATSARCAIPKPKKTFGFSMFFMFSSILRLPWLDMAPHELFGRDGLLDVAPREFLCRD